MGGRRPALWTDVALTLALVTLAAVLLNGGVAWLVVRQFQLRDRVTLAEQVAASIAATIAQETDPEARAGRSREILSTYRRSGLDFVELYIVDPSLQVVASAHGRPERAMDAGFRSAFIGRKASVDVVGFYLASSRVVATWPVSVAGPPVAAVRLVLPVQGATLLESRGGFLAAYVLFTGLMITAAGYVLLRRRLVVPIEKLRDGTARIARGDFEHRVDIEAAAELVALTDSLNRMAGALAEYRQQTTDQVHRLEDANQRLARAQDDLVRSARLASVGRLAAGIAHEVGNPLAAVVGYLDLLRASAEDATLREDLLERTQREVHRIHTILRELLEFARPRPTTDIEAGLREIVDEAVDTLRFQPVFRGLEVDVRVDPDVRVRGDPARLHQVLVNLLLNAADAMGGQGRVEITAEDEAARTRLSIRDHGPGLSAEVQAQLFEPFFTTKGPGGGMGLGLATSLAIMEQARGTLRGENHPEGGAVFWLAIPKGSSTLSP